MDKKTRLTYAVYKRPISDQKILRDLVKGRKKGFHKNGSGKKMLGGNHTIKS